MIELKVETKYKYQRIVNTADNGSTYVEGISVAWTRILSSYVIFLLCALTALLTDGDAYDVADISRKKKIKYEGHSLFLVCTFFIEVIVRSEWT